MRTTLLVLHGHTLNGVVMREGFAAIAERLGDDVDAIYPDAPHPCGEDTVARLYALWNRPRLPPPHYTWWDASDDGREYRGWEQSRELLRSLLEGRERVGVLGFSQGAFVTAALAAMSAMGALPPVAFAVMIAGRTPRADVLRPFFAEPVRVPSLHVWGESDPLGVTAPRELVERFDPATREVMTWEGAHELPHGAAADAIVAFVRAHASRA